MGEQERMKDEMEVGLHLLSQWERTVIYRHLPDPNAIKDDLYSFMGKIMMVFSFVQTSFITQAGISFCHYMSYSAPMLLKKQFPWQQSSFYGLFHNKQYLTRLRGDGVKRTKIHQ